MTPGIPSTTTQTSVEVKPLPFTVALRSWLQRTGRLYNPHLASEALRTHPHDFDLLVTDYNMPGFCGADLLREARAVRPDLPVALASGYITAEIEQRAIEEGVGALIHKPNDVEEFCEIVQQLVHGKSAAH